jgi:hypothetical protein
MATSRYRHCRWWVFSPFLRHESTFLPSFAPRPLRRFVARMRALTPRPARPGRGLPALRTPPSARTVPTHLSLPTIALAHHVSVVGFLVLLPGPRASCSIPGGGRPRPGPGVVQPVSPPAFEVGCWSGLGFAQSQQARRRERPYRVRHPTVRASTSCCSPPRLTTTQLQSVADPWCGSGGTSTR